jgi:hypothetical protein
LDKYNVLSLKHKYIIKQIIIRIVEENMDTIIIHTGNEDFTLKTYEYEYIDEFDKITHSFTFIFLDNEQ